MNHYRTIWLSDAHLGAPDCREDLLVDFLNCHGCDTLFLVGDIIDIRKIRRARSWPRRHEAAIACLLQKITSSKVIYISGNHDSELAWLRSFSSLRFSICKEHMHVTADGRRILVIHGDQADGEIRTD